MATVAMAISSKWRVPLTNDLGKYLASEASDL